MKRELFGNEIKQDSKTEFFSASDLVKAGNKWRLMNNLSQFNLGMYLKNPSVVEFMNELASKYNCIPIKKGRGGRGSIEDAQTWVHPLLFIDIALAISPKLKIEVYEWLFDHLIAFRNDSGDSYKKMAGALYERTSSKTRFAKLMQDTAIQIQQACGVQDWQRASEKQLKLRDKIHDRIYLLCEVLNDVNQAIRVGIAKTIREEHKQMEDKQ